MKGFISKLSSIMLIVGGFGILMDMCSDDNPSPREDNVETSALYSSNNTCSWCRQGFSGNFYSHLGKASGCYSSKSPSEDAIGKYCSLKCCAESRKDSCPTCL